MNFRKLDGARLAARLRWSAYRAVELLGAPGLVVIGCIVATLAADLALVRPALAHQRRALARIALQGAAPIQAADTAAGAASVLQRAADVPRILALIGRHGLPVHEVKYQHIAGGGIRSASNARIAMALPTSGSYAQFHELMAGLTAFRDVRAQSFTLRRNLPTERMLAIDLKLSMPLPVPVPGAASMQMTLPHWQNDDPQRYRDLFPAQDRQREIEAALPPPAPRPPEAPRAPPLPFRLAGIWAEETQRKFILSRGDQNGQIVIVCRQCSIKNKTGDKAGIGVGDRFFDDYRLKKIGPAQLTFTYLPLLLTQTIDIDSAMRAIGN